MNWSTIIKKIEYSFIGFNNQNLSSVVKNFHIFIIYVLKIEFYIFQKIERSLRLKYKSVLYFKVIETKSFYLYRI